MSAVTDTGPAKNEMSGGVKNLFTLLELLAKKPVYQKFLNAYQRKTIKYSELKNDLAKTIITFLKPIQERQKQLAKNKKQVTKILADGAKKAKAIAQKNITEIKQRMGLL